MLQQALGHLVDIWAEDKRKYKNDSDDTLVKKCQRLLPLCADLPDFGGRSSLGRTSRLFGLVIYEDVMQLLRDLPQTPPILTLDDERQRRRLFGQILEALRSNQTGLTPPPPLKVTEIFAAASSVNFEEWLRMARNNIALDVVAKIIGRKPSYFIKILKELRAEADLLEVTPLKPVI